MSNETKVAARGAAEDLVQHGEADLHPRGEKLVNVIGGEPDHEGFFTIHATQGPEPVTLPEATRADVPLNEGLFKFFPAALAAVATHTKRGGAKYHGGGELEHDRTKSVHHLDSLLRHVIDLNEAKHLGDTERVLREVDAIAWRALALSQVLHELLGDAPRAPAARG